MVELYKLWHEFLPHFPKTSRYTLGGKIDALFLDVLEFLFTASYLPKNQKLSILLKAQNKLDLIKFFIQIVWESKIIDTKKYIHLSNPLHETSKMLGGWIKSL